MLYLRIFLIAVLAICLSACPKKATVAKTPPPPPPPEPTAVIDINPSTAQPGQEVTVTWKTENATDVSIAQIGAVPPSGSRNITLTESTSYHLTARGPGGMREADARVTVTAVAENPEVIDESTLQAASSRLDVFFEFNDYTIRPDQVATVQADAQFLKEHPDMRIVVEGHCDETGSTEYNLALGDRRAEEFRAALQKAGVNSKRMRIVSYGKELPLCTEESEECWKRNRRAHIKPESPN